MCVVRYMFEGGDNVAPKFFMVFVGVIRSKKGARWNHKRYRCSLKMFNAALTSVALLLRFLHSLPLLNVGSST